MKNSHGGTENTEQTICFWPLCVLRASVAENMKSKGVT